MVKKQFLTVLLVIFLLIAPIIMLVHLDTVQAQATETITVYVINGTTNASIPFAYLELYTSNFSLVTSATTDANGTYIFTISTSYGTFFRLNVIASGYPSWLYGGCYVGVNTVALYPLIPASYHNIIVNDYETLASLTLAVADPTLLVQTGTSSYTLFGNIVIIDGGTLVVSDCTFTLDPSTYQLSDQGIYNGVFTDGTLDISNATITSGSTTGGTVAHVAINTGGHYTVHNATFSNLGLQSGTYPYYAVAIDTSTIGNTFSNCSFTNVGYNALVLTENCANQTFSDLTVTNCGGVAIFCYMTTGDIFNGCHDFSLIGTLSDSFAFHLFYSVDITIENGYNFQGYGYALPYTAWIQNFASINTNISGNSYVSGYDFGLASYDCDGIIFNNNSYFHDLNNEAFTIPFEHWASDIQITGNHDFYNERGAVTMGNVTNVLVQNNYNIHDMTVDGLEAEQNSSNVAFIGNYNIYNCNYGITTDGNKNCTVKNNYNIHNCRMGGIEILDGFVNAYYFGWPPPDSVQLVGSSPQPQPTVDIITCSNTTVSNNTVTACGFGLDPSGTFNSRGDNGGIGVCGIWGYPYSITVQNNTVSDSYRGISCVHERWLALGGGYTDPSSNVTLTNNTITNSSTSSYLVSNWDNVIFNNLSSGNTVLVNDTSNNLLNFTLTTANLAGVGNLTMTNSGGTFSFTSVTTAPTLTLTTNISTGYVLSFYLNGVFQSYTGLSTTVSTGKIASWIYTTIPTPTASPVPTLPPIVITGNTQAQFYMRSDQYNTFSVAGYGLDSSYTNTPETITETYVGNKTVTYGAEILLYSSPTINSSVTGGIIPLVNIDGNVTGEETANYNFPGSTITLGYQALLIQIYQQYNGGSWSSIAKFVTPTLVTSQVQSTTWVFSLYVNNTQANGFTYSKLNFGNKDYPSSISGIVFKQSPTADIAMWMYNRGDYVGLILEELTTPLGDSGFYALILLGFSGSLYYRYKNTGIILYFIVTMVSGGLLFYILPLWTATVAAALILLILTFTFWRLLR